MSRSSGERWVFYHELLETLRIIFKQLSKRASGSLQFKSLSDLSDKEHRNYMTETNRISLRQNTRVTKQSNRIVYKHPPVDLSKI